MNKRKIQYKLAEKEQTHWSSEDPVAHHQNPQIRNSFPQTKEILDRPVSKVPEKAPDKKTQTSNLPHQCNKHITIKRLREERSRFL